MAHPIPDPPAGVDPTDWASAIAAVRDYCEWHIAPEVTETITVDGPGGSLLALPTQRLVDLTDVVNDGSPVTDPEWSPSGLVRGGWSSRFGGVTVTITHGYEDWPADLLGVAKDMVDAAGRDGVSSVSSGTHSVRYEAPGSDRQTAILDRYRLVGLP